MLALGKHALRNSVALAPMAGVTDVPFRSLAWRLGVGYMVGEMTGSRPELAHTRKTLLRREAVAGALHSVQIAGTEADWMAQAARDASEQGASVIDINFGCPAKKVCRKAAGSALMAQPEQLLALARSTVAAAQEYGVPVTVKMRTGPSLDQRNAPELARRLRDCGVSGLAVHGRTRACKFGGKAEYDTIAEVKSAVDIPVFANGDIENPEDARDVLKQTSADGVMIGRAALGAPWLPGWIAAELNGEAYALPDLHQRLAWLMEQLLANHAFYGSEQGVRIARKHIQWTLKHPTLYDTANGTADGSSGVEERLSVLSKALVRAKTANEQLDQLANAFPRLAA